MPDPAGIPSDVVLEEAAASGVPISSSKIVQAGQEGQFSPTMPRYA